MRDVGSCVRERKSPERRERDPQHKHKVDEEDDDETALFFSPLSQHLLLVWSFTKVSVCT
jgi:hypothetical protein